MGDDLSTDDIPEMIEEAQAIATRAYWQDKLAETERDGTRTYEWGIEAE